jgi:hypothetical protein
MHKKPCSSVLTAASIVASNEEKIFACRADLMGCCVFFARNPIAAKKKCASVFCVVLKIHRLVICYNWLTEQASGHAKVLSGVVRQCFEMK